MFEGTHLDVTSSHFILDFDLAPFSIFIGMLYCLSLALSLFPTKEHEKILRDNIDSFVAIADGCTRFGVKLVYASSSTANPCNTTSMYGVSKHFDEVYASIYCRNATGVRLHNVYGPDQRKGTLLYALMNSEKVSLYNGGMNTRCFTYIDDVVDGLIYAIGSDKKLVNIVNPESCTILQFAEEVRKYNGVDIQCVSEKREFDNPVQSVDEGIFSVPLNYTSVSKGIAKVFGCEER
jgi:UDP-glucuronate 4-epimerase